MTPLQDGGSFSPAMKNRCSWKEIRERRETRLLLGNAGYFLAVWVCVAVTSAGAVPPSATPRQAAPVSSSPTNSGTVPGAAPGATTPSATALDGPTLAGTARAGTAQDRAFGAETALSSPTLCTPLGLGDAEALLVRAEKILADYPSTMPKTIISQAEFCIGQVGRYCARITEASAEQIPYQWIAIDKKRAARAPGDTNTYNLPVPVLGAMAARLAATRGDIFVKDMVVLKQSGARQKYVLNRWIFADLPKRPVVYFGQSTDVRTVQVTMYRRWPESARLALDLGVPNTPDYAREVAGLCSRAQTALGHGNLRTCRSATTKARECLRQFRIAVAGTGR